MRLIDADVLLEKINDIYDQAWAGQEFAYIVLQQLTINAEPVKHGRWIFKSRSKLINTEKLFVSSRVYTPKTLPASEYCEIPRGMSRCGNRGGDNEYDISKYCSECGARMDGDET